MSRAHEQGAVPSLDVIMEGITQSGDSSNELDALYGRMLILRTSNFLNMSFMVIAICLITATTILIFNGQDWALLLSYLVMLRVTAAGVKQISGSMVTVSRFFPEVEKLQIADSICRQSAEPQLDTNGILQPGLALADDEEIDE